MERSIKERKFEEQYLVEKNRLESFNQNHILNHLKITEMGENCSVLIYLYNFSSVPAFQQEGHISFSLFGMIPVPKVAPAAVAMGRDKHNL